LPGPALAAPPCDYSVVKMFASAAGNNEVEEISMIRPWGLQTLPNVRLTSLPRMADFALWAGGLRKGSLASWDLRLRLQVKPQERDRIQYRRRPGRRLCARDHGRAQLMDGQCRSGLLSESMRPLAAARLSGLLLNGGPAEGPSTDYRRSRRASPETVP
jgi:hypothetical protein